MTKQIHNQTNFTAGELTPRMAGRGDVARYQNGAGTIENGVVLVHGGVERRMGLRYLSATKLGGAKVSRLIKYLYSVDQAYQLEFGHLYVRIFDGTTGAVLLTPALAVLELASPYTAEQLAEVTVSQAGQRLFLYHPDVPTRVLQRLSATLWTLLPVRWIVEPFAEIGHFPDAGITIDNPAVGAGRTFTTAPVTAPGAPTSPVAVPLNGGARVTVVAPANSGGAPILSYTATASPGGLTGTSPTTTITIPGLTNGVAVTITVVANNKGGAGAPSVASNAVTPALGLPGSVLTVTSNKASFALEVANGYFEPKGGPTASCSDGVAPYAVIWTKISGGDDIAVIDGSLAKLNFSSEGYGATNYATFRATLVDAVGATGSIDVPGAVTHKTGAAPGTEGNPV